MELRRYLTVLRSRQWLILVATLLAAAVGYSIANTAPSYVARSTLYVGSRTVSLDANDGDLSNDRLAALDRIVLTFSKMIDSQPIALRAIQDLDIERSAGQVVSATKTTPEAATQLLYVDVTDPDPAVAQVLANAMSDAFVEAVQEFEPGTTEGSVPQLPAYVFERAQLPTVPQPTNQLQSTILGALFGLVAVASAAFLLDYLDLSTRTATDIEHRLELPVLGVIPSMGDSVPLSGRWAVSRSLAKRPG